MMRDIPAPGYHQISGKRRPPKSWGEELWCQIRTGWCDMHGPWKVETTNFIHDGSAGDVVAVRRCA
tara:strand:+ start:72 stop:269 length:198 start_codon:yes stop_codon:yes gene_type:complete